MIFKGQCKSLKRIASVETLWWKYWKFKKSNKNKKLNNISWARTFFEKSKNNIFKRKKTCLGVDAEVPRRPDERHLKKDIFWIFHFFLQILRQKSHSSIHNKSGNMWQAMVWIIPERSDNNSNDNKNNIDVSWIPKETSTYKRFLWIDHLRFVCQKNLVSIENLRILFMAVIAWYHRCHLLLMRNISMT